MDHPLANRVGIAAIAAHLQLTSPLCQDCGIATRKTSKRWAKCLKCGRMKIPRMESEEAWERIKSALGGAGGE